MHEFIISRLQCAATYPPLPESSVNETAAAGTIRTDLAGFMHEFIISRLQCAATYPPLPESSVNETAAAGTIVRRVPVPTTPSVPVVTKNGTDVVINWEEHTKADEHLQKIHLAFVHPTGHLDIKEFSRIITSFTLPISPSDIGIRLYFATETNAGQSGFVHIPVEQHFFPAPPQGLSVELDEHVLSHHITWDCSWNSVSVAVDYRVKQWAKLDDDKVVIARFDTRDNHFVYPNVLPGVQYMYKVKIIVNGVASNYTNPVEAFVVHNSPGTQLTIVFDVLRQLNVVQNSSVSHQRFSSFLRLSGCSTQVFIYEKYAHLQITLVFTSDSTESLVYDILQLNVLHTEPSFDTLPHVTCRGNLLSIRWNKAKLSMVPTISKVYILVTDNKWREFKTIPFEQGMFEMRTNWCYSRRMKIFFGLSNAAGHSRYLKLRQGGNNQHRPIGQPCSYQHFIRVQQLQTGPTTPFGFNVLVTFDNVYCESSGASAPDDSQYTLSKVTSTLKPNGGTQPKKTVSRLFAIHYSKVCSKFFDTPRPNSPFFGLISYAQSPSFRQLYVLLEAKLH
ncbi:hypothetical protein T265_01842 [Opisthorchis viverrini]|uniref:Fibronectin type-III domain-containing protein n=1 Tax=Opisthorchis viverrini TaxID=6198 RepID=A0A074ZX78_OPIVI|nr:hypothetical protein T265_01842 [Opisthorchis viverrini]KER32068.1 hypothetical protein T265_01842 [Opisthorchis viverrini]